MRLITIHVPDKYLDALERMIAKGLFPNRSEAIRVAIRDLIKNDNHLFGQSMENNEADTNGE